jgi:hypothetical protein
VRKSLIFFLFSFWAISGSYARVTHATTTGNWNSSGTWDNGIPQCGDTIIIDLNVKVTVTDHVTLDETSSCSTKVYLHVIGVIQFNTGKKMYLPCNSHIFVATGGEVKKGGGGGSANLIDICQTTVWSAGDGNVGGPTPIGPGLPIVLEYFLAEKRSDIVQFKWATLSEINNDFFTVERSSDLENTHPLMQLPGAGNSRIRLEYEAQDESPMHGVNYYRLKQTDYDGSFAYSNWLAVNVNNYAKHKVEISPNLVTDHLFIKIRSMEGSSASVFFYTATGKFLFEENTAVPGDSYIWQIDTRNLLGHGFVIAKVIVGENQYEEKLIIQ